ARVRHVRHHQVEPEGRRRALLLRGRAVAGNGTNGKSRYTSVEAPRLNCPRCKHGSFKVGEGFCCSNCHAGFVEQGTPVSGEPLVLSPADSSSHVLRRRGGLSGAWAVATLLGAMAVFSLGAK